MACWLALVVAVVVVQAANTPATWLVVNTWPFTIATDAAWLELNGQGSTAVDAVTRGCAACEAGGCGTSVGFGGSPDAAGETTLDAGIMDGVSLDVGAVLGLRRIKNAIGVARGVMDHTTHTFLSGDLATKFATDVLGFESGSLSTQASEDVFAEWKENNCQPNFYVDVTPDSTKQCGDYKAKTKEEITSGQQFRSSATEDNHDTIGMIVIDANGHIAAGTSTNGLTHKVPGRVGDSPIPGAGFYAVHGIGACVATGDGDIMVRFLPCYQAVESMRAGETPQSAADIAMSRIVNSPWNVSTGAVLVVDKNGNIGAASTFTNFAYNYRTLESKETKTVPVAVFTAETGLSTAMKTTLSLLGVVLGAGAVFGLYRYWQRRNAPVAEYRMVHGGETAEHHDALDDHDDLRPVGSVAMTEIRQGKRPVPGEEEDTI